MFGRHRTLTMLALSISVTTLAAPRAEADQVVLQNDSVTDFSQVAIQVGFAEDEKAAAWLTSICDGDLVAVRIYWASFTGGGGSTLAQSIEIFEAGAFPVPGTRLLELLGPVMNDGFLNEFTLPSPIPVTVGETVVVSFQFLTAPPALGPSVATDVDGCQAGKNGLFAIPPGSWFSSCDLGVSGDFVIRAVVDCTAALPIFQDGFESGNTSAWSGTVGG